MKDINNLCLVSSRGGHLYQLHNLKPWWKNYSRFWITFPGKDTRSLLRSEKTYDAFYPESRNVINAIKNLFLAISILKKEKPDLVISTGAGIAPPFFLIAKVFKIKTIFIEPYDFVKHPSLSGRLVALVADQILIQHDQQKKFHSNAKLLGSLI